MTTSRTTHPMDGFVRLPRWWWSACGYDGGLIEVLAALSTFDLKGDGVVFPSQTTLAELIGKSRQYVNKKLKALVDAGLIAKRNRRQARGGETSCSYTIIYQPDSTSRAYEDPSTEICSSSPSITAPVNQDDSNNQIPNLSHSEVLNWEPEDKTLQAIVAASDPKTARRFVHRFKKRVALRGYQYADLDEAILRWWAEDSTRKLPMKRPTPARQVLHADPDEVAEADRILRTQSEPITNRIAAAFLRLGTELKSLGFVRSWLAPLQIDPSNGSGTVLRAPTAYHRDYVQTHCHEIIKVCLERVGLGDRPFTIVSS